MDDLELVKKNFLRYNEIQNSIQLQLKEMDKLKESNKEIIRNIIYSCTSPSELIEIIKKYDLDCYPRMVEKAYNNTFSDKPKSNSPHWEDILFMCYENLLNKIEKETKKEEG